jgi:ubiquinone/menaquinone biosynthesis C-methylase UbiE
VFIGTLHRLAEHPWVYDRIQAIAGNNRVFERLSRQIVPLHPKIVVDIGGGTGSVQSLFPLDCMYICVDREMPKLLGFRSKVPHGKAVLADVTALPISDNSVDMVICKAVTHHLTNVMLEQTFAEAHRVLRAGGNLVLLDAILNRRFVGQLLWTLDRGSHPRSEEELHQTVNEKFKIAHWETFAIYHEYVLGVGVRR